MYTDMDFLKRKLESEPDPLVQLDDDCNNDEDSISSAEKEVRMRQERRQRKKIKATRAPLAAILSAEDIKTFQVQEDGGDSVLGDFKVMPLEDIVKSHPELGDATRRMRAHRSTQHADDMPTEPEQPNPPLTDAVNEFIQNMPRPEFVDLMHHGVNNQTHVERIHQRIVMLPIQRAELESVLLAEAGIFAVSMQDEQKRTYSFPACMRGPKCEGMTAQLPGFTAETPGAILTAFMFQHEYDAFLETGMPIAQPRCCVLCMRAAFSDFALLTRNNCGIRMTLPSDFSVQVYRNLMDEVGGYYQAYLWTPFRREEGFADCMAIFTRSALRAFQDPTQSNRWVIDQSAMVYQPPQPMPFVLNETVEDFLLRAEEFEGVHASSDWNCTQRQIALHDPFLFLTRYFETFSHPEAAAWIHDRAHWTSPLETHSLFHARLAHQELTALQQCKTLPCEVRETICQAIDLNAAMLYADYTDADRAFLSMQWFHPNTFPFHVAPHVRQVCFWEQLRFSYVSPLAHLFGKSSNQPCQTRKFSSIVKRFARDSPVNHAFLRIVVITNLMGNYPGVAEHRRLSVEWRTHLRMVHHRSPDVWDAFINKNPLVLLFSMRFMLVWFVRDDPILFRHVCHLGAWQEFEAVIFYACQRIRDFIQADEPPPRGQWNTLFTDATAKSISDACDAVHPDILATCYQRQRTGLLHFIHTCTQRPANRLDRYVSPEVHDTLRRIIKSLDTRQHSIQNSVIPLLPHLGVPRSALNFITQVSDNYENMRLGKRALRQKLNAFQQRYPYSFEVLQIVSGEWKRQSSRFLVPIPSHYVHAQLHAISQRSETSKQCQAIPLELLHAYYCDSCSRTASVIRAPPSTYYTPPPHKNTAHEREDATLKDRQMSTLQQTFNQIHGRLGPPMSGNNIFRGNISAHQRRAMESVIVGYAECVLDLVSNQVYCKNNRTQTLSDCYSQPLNRVFLLGFAWWNNGWMLLCPHCCILFVYVPHQCIYTRDGFVCHICTQHTRLTRLHLTNPLLPAITRETKLKCALCCQTISRARNAILLPYGLLICKRHNTNRMRLLTRSAHIMTKKQLEQAIIEEHVITTRMWREKNNRGTKAKHKQAPNKSSYHHSG